MQLIVLAAGLGTRFGGVKQLAPVGPHDEAIIDITLRRAADAGFTSALVIVRPAIVDLVQQHFSQAMPPAIPVQLVEQRPVPGWSTPIGTAHAVLACRDAITGPFAVANADDLYPPSAFVALAAHLQRAREGEHALVAFPVAGTVISDQPVTRALIFQTADARLVQIDESTVTPVADGFRFANDGASGRLVDDAQVSMNLWGFAPSIIDVLAHAVEERLATESRDEVRLPDVVASIVADGGVVRVLACAEPCIGITHPEDVAVVRAALA